MIEIIREFITRDINNKAVSRSVEIVIDDNYIWPVGGLPLEGDLQPILEANEARYLAKARAAGALLPQESHDQLGAKNWFKANPGATQLFTTSVSELESEISDLVEASFTLLLPSQKTKWKLLLMALALSVRIFARRLGLLD